MKLVSVPEEYQGRFDWPNPKTVTVPKTAAFDGFNLEELLQAKFTFVYEDENGVKHPIPNANIELINLTGTYKHNISTDENGVAPNDGSYLKMVPWGYFINFDFDNDPTFKKFNESELYKVTKIPYFDANQTVMDNKRRLIPILGRVNPFEPPAIKVFKVEATDAKNHGPVIADEVIEKGGKVDLTDNVSNLKDLPEGTKVEDITEAGKINTNVPGEYIGKIKITYPDGSSLIKEVRVIVEERNRKPLFPWLELGKYESYGNKASKETPKATMIHSAYIKGLSLIHI